MNSQTSSLKVILRIRPSTYSSALFEVRGNEIIFNTFTPNISNTSQTQKTKTIKFSHIFKSEDSQEEMFQNIAPSLINDFFTGCSGLIFAYGLTNSGKTYTIEGENNKEGFIFYLLKNLIKKYDKNPKNKCIGYITMSFAEIYQEKIFDLFSRKKIPLKIKLDNLNNVYISNLKEIKLDNLANAIYIIKKGFKVRHYSDNKYNNRSSRSHSVFTLKLVPYENQKDSFISKICVIDLAGAEKTTELFSNSSLHEESIKINNSLSVLGRVLTDLKWNQKNPHKMQRIIPWRESNITRLMQSYFLGNGKCYMFVTVFIIPKTYKGTMRVLDYASIASQIVTYKKFYNKTINNSKIINKKIFESEYILKKCLPPVTYELLENLLQHKEVFSIINKILPKHLLNFHQEISNYYLNAIKIMYTRNKKRIREERAHGLIFACEQIKKFRIKYKEENEETHKKMHKNKLNELEQSNRNNLNKQNKINDLEIKVEDKNNKIEKLKGENYNLNQKLKEITNKFELKNEEYNKLVSKYDMVKMSNGTKKLERNSSRVINESDSNISSVFEGKGDLFKLRVVDLKKQLRDLGLFVYGNKKILVNRLWEYLHKKDKSKLKKKKFEKKQYS